MDINELFIEAKTGNTEAEKELFSILLVRFKLIASHIIGERDAANDAAHDAAMSVLKTYHKLEVHTSFMAWAQTIIRRQAIQYMKKRNKERRITQEMSKETGINAYFETSPLFNLRLAKCLKKLSATDKRYLRVLNLRHLGFTFEEICAKMSINYNNAYVLLHRARKALLSCLNKGEN
ncbi:MAG: RNA polymerase sigma factor [candidate division Zixibacteria bacterium]|nr:RNA polymerase sigma factor [candidate division Zixibacteria bacterium]